MLASVAQARPIDWQAELDRCRAMREQMEPLLLAGQGLSPIARSGAAARRCVWVERRALKRGADDDAYVAMPYPSGSPVISDWSAYDHHDLKASLRAQSR
jgi:hypothetical protein